VFGLINWVVYVYVCVKVRLQIIDNYPLSCNYLFKVLYHFSLMGFRVFYYAIMHETGDVLRSTPLCHLLIMC